MVVEFFKVFLPDQSSHQLLIPPAFVNEHRELIQENLVLIDLTGTQWHVDVERDGKKMYITNGWRDFVTDNSLEYGDFIVFTCGAKSVYGVQLFGKDSCLKLKGNDSFNDDDVAPFSKKDYSANQVHYDSGSPRACNRIPTQAVPISTIDGSVDLPRSQSRRLDGMSGEKSNDMLHAKSLVKPDAPHCIISIKHYHLYTMRFPPEPLRRDGIELAETVHLRDHNDKLWPMKLYFPTDGQAPVLSTGWSDFRKHMKLKCGDQCLLEFVLERGNICKELKIQVSYANPRKRKVLGSPYNLPQSQSIRADRMSDEKPKIMLNAQPLVRPKAPHCIVFIKTYNLYAMHIPPTPLREYGIKLAENVVLRDHNGELWPIKLYFSGDGRSVNLSSGWTEFRRHMNLKCGDQCLFEFVLERGNICKELKVEVFHAICET